MRLLLIVVMCLIGFTFISPTDYVLHRETYIVQTNDTVWEVAARYMDKQDKIHDVRELCWEIKKENSLHNYTIHAGQILTIPLYKEKSRQLRRQK